MELVRLLSRVDFIVIEPLVSVAIFLLHVYPSLSFCVGGIESLVSLQRVVYFCHVVILHYFSHSHSHHHRHCHC
jgi:hypothetical protein